MQNQIIYPYFGVKLHDPFGKYIHSFHRKNIHDPMIKWEVYEIDKEDEEIKRKISTKSINVDDFNRSFDSLCEEGFVL